MDTRTVLAILAFIGIAVAGAAYTASEQIEEHRRERGQERGKLPLILAAPMIPLAVAFAVGIALLVLFVAADVARNVLASGVGVLLLLVAGAAAVAYRIGKAEGRAERKDDRP